MNDEAMSGQDRVEILLLEDNPGDAELFRKTLHGEYKVTVAQTGPEALDRLFQRGKFSKGTRPHVVVLDLNVPLLNGHEVLNVIKSNSSLRSIPVIVFSISDQIEDVQKAYELGACAYVVKPSGLQETEKALSAFADFWIRQVVFPGLMRVPRTSEAVSSSG